MANIVCAISVLSTAPWTKEVAAAEPGASPWVGTAESQARLVSAASAVGGDTRIMLGVQIRLAPGWKTYWRDPGDAGIPPRFDWTGSENLAAVEVRWPAPKRFASADLDSFGYHDEIVFPLEVRLEQAGVPLKVHLLLDYGACEEICIPVREELSLTLPAGPAGSTIHARLIGDYRGKVPATDKSASIEIERARVEGAPGEQILALSARSLQAFVEPDVMVEAAYPFRFGRPEIHLSDDRHRVELKVPVFAGRKRPALAGHEVVLTLIDGDRAVERRLVLATDG